MITIRQALVRLFSVLSALFIFLLLFYCEGARASLAILLAVLLHELGHIFAFFLLGEKPPRLALRPLGITLTPRRMLSYGREACVAFFGPFFNLLTYFLCAHAESESLTALTSASLLLAAMHLLPVIPLDGGRISFALLHALFGECGARVASFISFLALAAALFFFLYFLLFYGVGLAPVFSLLLLFGEQEAHYGDL